MITITVLSEPDRAGMTLRTRVQHVAAAHPRDVRVDLVELGSGVGQTTRVAGLRAVPAVLFDGEPVIQGEVPRLRDLQALVEKALREDARLIRKGLKDAAAPTDRHDVPVCTGCVSACALDEPGCAVGMQKAKAQGIRPRT